MKLIRVLIIEKDGANVIDIENTNTGFNNALGWGWHDAWNTPTISVNGKKFIAVCSDTGKIRNEQVACIGRNNLMDPKDRLQEPFIVGTTIITKFDGIDDFEDLTSKDIDLLIDNLIDNKKRLKGFFKKVLILD
jgi:hypothetical protein